MGDGATWHINAGSINTRVVLAVLQVPTYTASMSS